MRAEQGWWGEDVESKGKCVLLCRHAALLVLLTRDENVNTQREETQSTKIKTCIFSHLRVSCHDRGERGAGGRMS